MKQSLNFASMVVLLVLAAKYGMSAETIDSITAFILLIVVSIILVMYASNQRQTRVK